MTNFDAVRKNMVDCQLRTNAIVNEAVLDAMGAVPREAFLPDELQPIAYIDEDLELGNGRFLIEPLVLARLLQMAEVAPSDAVLVVGCGSGYASAVLARMASSVVTVECDADRATISAAALREQGCDNVVVVEGDLKKGCRDQAPYNVILFTGAVASIPPEIAEQLDENGRLVCVVDVECEGLGRAVLMTRHHGHLSERIVYDASTPILPGFAREEGFVF
ncbi:MAG: protein-L-isoaspartate O-methyltransferase [Alphaproteobacteria bacterium]|nr:protein-L-isoaspartate O-methyltransferase [Alphaproteobacteria bacterium]MCZ6765111.1 protein-L-isoaspartate O-methyltransferase [Alphaproteobacteria bacterium]